jgi:hypothetical protein
MKSILLSLALLIGTIAFGDTTDLKACNVSNTFPCLDPDDPKIVLIGGELADTKAWPNSLITNNCSITVVGERVAVHAAHCVRNGGTVQFSKGGNRYSAKCEHHPDYRNNSTADWALCKTDSVVEGGEYEILNTSKTNIKVGTTLTLSGYGCTKWGGGGFGKLRIGNAPVVRIPSGSNHDIVTKGNVALCSGDSGGASFIQMQFGHRYLVGVNSRSNTTTTSYMPSWAQDAAVKWGLGWAQRNDVKICGYHEDAKSCRTGFEKHLEKATVLLGDLMKALAN